MRIAVASSGLGHIRRGIETWAEDLACALRRAGEDVTLFQGGGEPMEPWRIRLSCLQRFDRRTGKLQRLFRRIGGWHYGMGSDYQIEQTTFALSLWRRIHSDYDILHVQDPWLALVLDRLHWIGLSRPKVILAHGTEESAEFLCKLSNLQHLTPAYNEEWQQHRPPHQFSVGIPNFVDTERFCPGDRTAVRKEWELPESAFVVLTVAALKKTHKRCDYVIREFAEFRKTHPTSMLMLAGGRESETDDVIQLARSVGEQAVRVFPSVPRDRLLGLYQVADVFVLGSLWEMMPIALLEALSCGLPVICHDNSTLRWMVGDGGWNVDLRGAGALVNALEHSLLGDLRSVAAQAARNRAICMFSERIVVGQIRRMCAAVAQHASR